MKTLAVVIVLSVAVAASKLERFGCATSCVSRIALVDGCVQSDLACHCSKAGVIKQLQPCMESTCSDAKAFEEATKAFTQACSSAGIAVRFNSEKKRRDELDMPMQDMPGMAMTGHDGMVGMGSSSPASHEGMNMGSPSGHEGMTMGAGSSNGASPAPAPAVVALSSGSHEGMNMGASAPILAVAPPSSGSSGQQDMAGMSGHEGMAGMGGSAAGASPPQPPAIAAPAGTLSPTVAKPNKVSSAVTTTAGARPALYTGAASAREVGRGLLGFAAAFAVAF